MLKNTERPNRGLLIFLCFCSKANERQRINLVSESSLYFAIKTASRYVYLYQTALSFFSDKTTRSTMHKFFVDGIDLNNFHGNIRNRGNSMHEIIIGNEYRTIYRFFFKFTFRMIMPL